MTQARFSDDDRFFLLPNGTAVPTEAVALGCRLERMGFTLKREGQHLRLAESPTASVANLAPEIVQEIRANNGRMRDYLLLIVDYIDSHH